MLKSLCRRPTGAPVQQWHLFLHAHGLLRLETTESFDQATEDATKAFQIRHRLLADGIIGNQTTGKAAQLGFEVVDFDDNTEFLAKPRLPPTVSNQQFQTRIGPNTFEPKPTASHREAIRLTNGWNREYIVVVTVRQLIGKTGANPQGKVSPQGRRPTDSALAGAGRRRICSAQGTHIPRFIRGGAAQQILSNHAFGPTCDINADRNLLRAEPATPDQKSCGYGFGAHRPPTTDTALTAADTSIAEMACTLRSPS
jgi:hypothetical protein